MQNADLDQARSVLVATRDHLRAEAERYAADAEKLDRALACLDEVWSDNGAGSVADRATEVAEAPAPEATESVADVAAEVEVESEPDVDPPTSAPTADASCAAEDDGDEPLILTDRERAVMMQLWKARDDDFCVALRYAEISTRSGIPQGSLGAMMQELQELKCIRMVRQADAKTPATWRLLCDPDGNPALAQITA